MWAKFCLFPSLVSTNMWSLFYSTDCNLLLSILVVMPRSCQIPKWLLFAAPRHSSSAFLLPGTSSSCTSLPQGQPFLAGALAAPSGESHLESETWVLNGLSALASRTPQWTDLERIVISFGPALIHVIHIKLWIRTALSSTNPNSQLRIFLVFPCPHSPPWWESWFPKYKTTVSFAWCCNTQNSFRNCYTHSAMKNKPTK